MNNYSGIFYNLAILQYRRNSLLTAQLIYLSKIYHYKGVKKSRVIEKEGQSYHNLFDEAWSS